VGVVGHELADEGSGGEELSGLEGFDGTGLEGWGSGAEAQAFAQGVEDALGAVVRD
jgi:hypothetical protein